MNGQFSEKGKLVIEGLHITPRTHGALVPRLLVSRGQLRKDYSTAFSRMHRGNVL